jgi:hypothetical protein
MSVAQTADDWFICRFNWLLMLKATAYTVERYCLCCFVRHIYIRTAVQSFEKPRITSRGYSPVFAYRLYLFTHYLFI